MKIGPIHLRAMAAKLFGSYLLFFCLFIAWIFCYQLVQQDRIRMHRYENALLHLESDYLEFSSEIQDLILVGYTEASFYSNDGKPAIQQLQKSYQQLQTDIITITALNEDLDLALENKLDELIAQNDSLQNKVLATHALLLDRGFRDFGLEGSMRDYAHELEDQETIPIAELLQLRRHEKDYLLRGDNAYVAKFNTLLNDIRQNQVSLKDSDLHKLTQYAAKFNALVALDTTLGIRTETGLYESTKALISELQRSIAEVISVSTNSIEDRISFNKRLLFVISFLGILVAITFTFITSRLLSKDLNRLANRISNFYKNGFVSTPAQQHRARILEVDYIHDKFDALSQYLESKLNELEEAKKQAEQVANYKTMFLANMSHEIRTPLNGIIGMIHVLKQSTLDEKQQHYMDVISFSSDHLLSLVNMILDYSKIDAGKLELQKEPFDITEGLVKTTALFDHTAKEKGLHYEIKNELPPSLWVIGDRIRIHQVVLNLINNAIKFTDTGSIITTFATKNYDDQNVTLVTEVSDTGVGIAPDKISGILEAFEQNDKSTTRQFGGTGLGLTISNRLLQLMGSQLQIQSELGVGSTFSFEVTFALAEKPKVPATHVLQRQSQMQQKVLVAEDNLVNQEVLKIMLESYAAEVTIVPHGASAVDTYLKDDFNLVLMDLHMPEMDGWDATKAIFNSEKYAERKTPIVAVTANAFDSDQADALDFGFDDFLAKPIQPEALEAVLAKFGLHKANATTITS